MNAPNRSGEVVMPLDPIATLRVEAPAVPMNVAALLLKAEL
jgi:hypothetical protein